MKPFLAVMIENLFKFAATISFGTLKRLEEKLEEATKASFQALSLADRIPILWLVKTLKTIQRMLLNLTEHQGQIKKVGMS